MANITKHVDLSVKSTQRYQMFKSTDLTDAGGSIAAGDVIKVEDSLGKVAHYIYVETEASAGLSIRFNSIVTVFPVLQGPTHGIVGHLDLQNPATHTDNSMAAIEIDDGTTWEFKGVIPVSDIEIVTGNGVSAGGWEIFVA